jgi:hypothetical protein
VDSTGVARAIATATGGNGGIGSGWDSGSPSLAGAGGIASNTTAFASGLSAYATAVQIGGDGGAYGWGVRGGAGANSILTDAVSGTATGSRGTLGLYQVAMGGAGGAGQAGTAYSSLTFNDVRVNATHATSQGDEARLTRFLA